MPSIPYAGDISKNLQVKSFPVTRTQTAGTDRAFVLPKNARLVGYVLSGSASNAGTTATLSVGTTSGTPTEHVNAVNVLAAGSGNGVNLLNGVAGALGAKLTSDTLVYVKYAETGAASTLGSWWLHVFYVTDSSSQTGIYQ
jgi:hypothetical protein